MYLAIIQFDGAEEGAVEFSSREGAERFLAEEFEQLPLGKRELFRGLIIEHYCDDEPLDELSACECAQFSLDHQPYIG